MRFIELCILYEGEQEARLSDLGIDYEGDEYWGRGFINPDHISAIVVTYSGNTNIWLLSGEVVTTYSTPEEILSML